jgi:hypothetical protein
MDHMGEGSSGPGPAWPAGAGESDATRTFPGREPVARPRPAEPANPLHPPTEIVPSQQATEIVPSHPPTDIVPFEQTTDIVPFEQAAEVVRYGPGVPATPPASQAGLTAEHIWRTGLPPEARRRPARQRRWFGTALTVLLLAASGVVLYLRFHHAPFHVTGVVISQQTRTGCGVDVTGQIATNGSAGTVSYQWVFRSDRQPPQPLSQSVVAGQHAAYVTVAVEGKGHGSASQTVTLQVLGPDPETASKDVVVSC